MKNILQILFVASSLMFGFSFYAASADRFPRPDFTETKHQYPVVQHVQARPVPMAYVDASVLLAALVAAALTLRKRSRMGLVLLALFSVSYFGFYRQGCVCSVGSLQNISHSIFQNDFFLPAAVVIFFSLPLVFALFFGRIFCAAVCPLGSLQESVLLKPVKIPVWIDRLLRFIPYIYLSMAVLMAATGTGYIICRFDPFVSLYRFNGSFDMLVLTGCFIILALFIGRPYCRFLCPYGVLLNLCSACTSWHTSITPDKCVKCGLCKNACPYGAIKIPVASAPESVIRKDRMLLKIFLVAWPFIIISGAILGLLSAEHLSRLNRTVETAKIISSKQENLSTWQGDLVASFKQSGIAEAELYSSSARIGRHFSIGASVAGGFLGLMLGFFLVSTRIRTKQEEFQPDHGLCFSCGRCHSYCPREKTRLKKLKEECNAG